MGLRIALLYTKFAGMPQAMWGALRDDGHDVVRPEDLGFDTPLAPQDMALFAMRADAHLILCPFLKEVVPPEVCRRWSTWVPHPGVRGDAGPSSLSWAILDREPVWGVTMVRAEPSDGAEDLDSGAIGAWREFDVPADATMAEVYAQYAIPAAVACALEVVRHTERQRDFAGAPLDRGSAKGRYRPVLRQDDLAFAWSDPADAIARRVRAATFGVRTVIDRRPLNAFDAHVHDGAVDARPGEVVAEHDGALLMAAGDGTAVWIGHAKVRRADGGRAIKLPTAHVTPARPGKRTVVASADRHVVRYRRDGKVGWVHAPLYNGAASTDLCDRLVAALEHAAAQDTDAIALVGGRAAWNNGIHLGVIEAADDAKAEAWRNIQRIDDVAELVFNLSRGGVARPQTTIAVLNSSAGAGGAVLSACFDMVLARPSINLNYHYATMGLTGSELRSLVLPMRAGEDAAKRLLHNCLPTTPTVAKSLGLVDEIGPDDPAEFDAWACEMAREIAAQVRPAQPSIDTRPYRDVELEDMRRDIFEDRYGFERKRRDFLGVNDS